MAATEGELMDLGEDEALKSQKRTSKYRGVCWNKKNRRWQASINVGGRYHYLGSFLSEDHAARAFDKAAFEIRGKRAKLNFADSPDLIASGALGDGPAIRPEALVGPASAAAARSNGASSADLDGSPDTQQHLGSSKGPTAAASKRRKWRAPLEQAPQSESARPALASRGDAGNGADAPLQAYPYNFAADGALSSLTPEATAAVMNLLGEGAVASNRGAQGTAIGSPRAFKAWQGSGRGDLAGGQDMGADAAADVSAAMRGGGHLTSLFTNFGETSCVTRLIPDAYQQYRLLGAVIENVRDSSHWAAAVWDGKRVHTLEGFLDEGTAERSARDLIDMLLALKAGGPAVEYSAGVPLPGTESRVRESEADGGRADGALLSSPRPAKAAKLEPGVPALASQLPGAAAQTAYDACVSPAADGLADAARAKGAAAGDDENSRQKLAAVRHTAGHVDGDKARPDEGETLNESEGSGNAGDAVARPLRDEGGDAVVAQSGAAARLRRLPRHMSEYEVDPDDG